MQDNTWKNVKQLFVHASGQWKKVKYLNTKQGDTWKLAYIGYDTTDIFLDEGEVLTSDSDAGSARGHDLHMGKITYLSLIHI